MRERKREVSDPRLVEGSRTYSRSGWLIRIRREKRRKEQVQTLDTRPRGVLEGLNGVNRQLSKR